MSEHTAEIDAALEEVLLTVLMAEYGGTVEDWTSLRSLKRLVRAIRECVVPPEVGQP